MSNNVVNNSIFIQALQPTSPNDMLKELVFADHTSEELDTLHQEALKSVLRSKTLFYTSYLSMERSKTVDGFIVELTECMVANCRRDIHKTLEEYSSSSSSELETLIMKNVVFGTMHISHEKTKTAVWLWKSITSSLLEEIIKAINSDIDKVFQLVHEEKDVWKKAFLHQPDIQPVRIEYMKFDMIKTIDEELAGVDIADTEQLRTLFLRTYLEAEQNLLIANIVLHVFKQLGTL